VTRGAYVPLSVNYGEDDRVLDAGPLAELVYLRALALSGRLLSDGFITDRQLDRLGLDLVELVYGAGHAEFGAVIDRLVRVGLLVREEGPPSGYRIRSWHAWNLPAEEVRARQDARREADRTRQQRRRARLSGGEDGQEVTAPSHRDDGERHDTAPRESRVSRSSTSTSGSTSASTSSSSTAAAAHSVHRPGVDKLRAELTEAKLLARWDRLDPDELDEVEQLVQAHGVTALVRAAQREHQEAQPAAYARAWLAGWRVLPQPLRVVRERCPAHPYLAPAASCSACAADRKAASS
jgi:hypothetical protein